MEDTFPKFEVSDFTSRNGSSPCFFSCISVWLGKFFDPVSSLPSGLEELASVVLRDVHAANDVGGCLRAL